MKRDRDADSSAFVVAMKDIVAGTARGATQTLVGQPLDTIKNRIQFSPSAFGESTLSCIAQTWRIEGWRGFYRGASAPLATTSAYSATLFLAYGQSRAFVRSLRGAERDRSAPLNDAELVAAAAATGVLCSVVEGPSDLLKVQRQVSNRFNSSLHVARAIVRDYGASRLFLGLPHTTLRNGIGAAAYFFAYERLKDLLTENIGMSAINATLMAGGTAGCIFWLSILPIDVTKTLVQCQDLSAPLRSTREIVASLYRASGWRAFTRGFAPLMIRAWPVNAASFLAFELVRSLW